MRGANIVILCDTYNDIFHFDTAIKVINYFLVCSVVRLLCVWF
nr:MAG TPA: hypothetical protein [Caudoviricetes sp.]